ncbi:MFS transporter [Propionimicrobium sp. PCR01-08-3]|uniref:MFS transporter n=1 Tax=Propionimicrobium sp. PCR01-08-3 TaxID=3052086 RepID=UPI00255C993F|nr:MFS transporter [Propionimicrobium sp. PCR01-08-3]WIY81742.1 MFS transporter [Propionimicrobium sp. PCR01-08-3]
MMISTILIEAWDLYAISFVLVFIKAEYNPNAVELSLVAAAVQGGALIGALLGGVVADRLGRKKVFLLTMALFIVLSIAQAFSQNIIDLIVIRLLIGIPLGSDISNGYAYIMESMSKGAREQMGSRWQGMFGLGEVFAIIVITVLYATSIFSDEILWRVALGLGCVPAIILLIMRLDLPETPLSLIQRGKFVKAKATSKVLFDDDLDMLPNEDVVIEKPKLHDFLSVIWKDPIKKRASIFGWISNACQGAEFTAWAFYLPFILTVAGVAGAGNIIGSNLVTALVFCLATVSGFVAPMMLPRIGHKGLSMWGFGLAFIGLMIGAFSLGKIAPYEALSQTPPIAWGSLLVIGACILMWGHYWDASNGMTIVSMAAPSRFRATASGFGYVFVKAASFFGAFVFPVITEYLGNRIRRHFVDRGLPVGEVHPSRDVGLCGRRRCQRGSRSRRLSATTAHLGSDDQRTVAVNRIARGHHRSRAIHLRIRVRRSANNGPQSASRTSPLRNESWSQSTWRWSRPASTACNTHSASP